MWLTFHWIQLPCLPHSSKPILTDLLRNDLGYKGLIISDDLEMYGADVHSNIGEKSCYGSLAGVDMVMVAWSHNKQVLAYKRVLSAARTGRIDESIIDEKVLRILTAKQRYLA
ncbi:MAG: glycoside hydrolase family 3 N-terminal domain-containing protein [Bdellovibrionales bacterium]